MVISIVAAVRMAIADPRIIFKTNQSIVVYKRPDANLNTVVVNPLFLFHQIQLELLGSPLMVQLAVRLSI